MTKKQPATNCEQCEHYVYDDLMEYYVCEVDLDQDEMEDFLNYNTHHPSLPLSLSPKIKYFLILQAFPCFFYVFFV